MQDQILSACMRTKALRQRTAHWPCCMPVKHTCILDFLAPGCLPVCLPTCYISTGAQSKHCLCRWRPWQRIARWPCCRPCRRMWPSCLRPQVSTHAPSGAWQPSSCSAVAAEQWQLHIHMPESQTHSLKTLACNCKADACRASTQPGSSGQQRQSCAVHRRRHRRIAFEMGGGRSFGQPLKEQVLPCRVQSEHLHPA